MLAACLLLFAPAALSAEPVWVERSEEVMTTRIDVVLPEAHADLADQVFAVFRDVEERANEWRAGTPIAVLNAAGGVPVPMDAELRGLVRRGVEIGERTDGAFDITWAALWGAWDFRASPPRLPDARDLAERTSHVDFRGVVIDDEAGTVQLGDPQARLGLGGIAKGWALDRSAALLRESGVTDFSLSAGGQVMLGGHRGDRKWRVGIRDPRGNEDDFYAAIEASDVSVSTSGDYERYFELDGVRYHHILDPRTGRPPTELRSVTVVCADATLADALSTAILVLGRQKGLQLAEAWEGAEALVVDSTGSVHATAGIAREVALVHPPRH